MEVRESMSLAKMVAALAAAVCLLLAVAAQASALAEFEANQYPVVIRAKAETAQKWSFGAVGAECSEVTLRSPETNATVIKAAVGSVTMDPVYSLCKAFGFAKAEVRENGCEYTFHITGSFDIANCAAGKEIEIAPALGVCVIGVSPQAGLLKVKYENVGTEIRFTFSLVKLKYKVIKAGLGCPAEGEEATYIGTVLAKGLLWNETTMKAEGADTIKVK
jgi:hypothetical protein